MTAQAFTVPDMANAQKMLAEAKNVFFIGLGGSGMRGLAKLLAHDGKNITGTDAQAARLTNTGFDIRLENDCANELAAADVVVYSDAITTQHPVRTEAQAAGKPVVSYQAALGAYAAGYENVIAVAGTHGKSSTTAMLGHIVAEAGLDPAVLVGATVAAWQGNARPAQHKKYFIVEADEYREHFLTLRPTCIVLTTIDFDHPDFFADPKASVAAFQRFLSALPPQGTVITPETLVAQFKDDIVWPASTVAVTSPKETLPVYLPGQHMQQNAALAVAAAACLGIAAKQSSESLRTFTGLSRRFETIGKEQGMTVVSDYGHHPTEITATLRAAREQFPEARIAVLLEPHTEERFVRFFSQFTDALADETLADTVVVCPLYRARATDAPKHDIDELVTALAERRKNIEALTTYDELSDLMAKLAKTHDIALAFTAGELDHQLRILLT